MSERTEREPLDEQAVRESLEDVLDAYLASVDGPDSASLAEWRRRYPRHAQELMAFAASWSLARWLPPSAESADVDEGTLVQRGKRIVERVARERAPRAAEKPPRGLLEEAKARGLSLQQLAERAGLSVALVRKLDRRLIRYSTIPRQAIEALARALQRDAEAVARYLQQGPTFAASARYRADRAPTLAEPEDFFAAVRADPTLSPERRRAWLALERREG